MEKSIVAILIKPTDSSRWDSLLRRSSYSSYRNSLVYEPNKETEYKKVSTFIFSQNGVDLAGATYILNFSYKKLIIVADITSGIVFASDSKQTLFQFIINHFTKWAKENKASFLRIKTWTPIRINTKTTQIGADFQFAFRKKGYRVIQTGRFSYWLDLTKNEEELLQGMKRQTRYEIRRALKAEITTQIIDEADNKIIQEFWELYKHLSESKGFKPYSELKFISEITSLLNAGAAKLFVLKYENKTINISIASCFGISEYIHGAINPDFKSIPACPPPGQLAQWKMITEMKKLGIQTYDMGFCPGPEPIKGHPAYNIWRFKYGFGGDSIEYMPTYGKILHPIKGLLFKLIRYKKLT